MDSAVFLSPSKTAVPSRRSLPSHSETTKRTAQSAKPVDGRGKVTTHRAKVPTSAPDKVVSVKVTPKKSEKPGFCPDTGPRRHPKPSASLNPRTIDPFGSSAAKTRFESAYENGGIPCRLVHGSVKHKLHWETPPEKLHFDPLLVTLMEGLSETRHPFTFIAREGVKELLMVEDAEEKTIPMVPRLVAPIKQALSSSNSEVFERGLGALGQVSSVVGIALNPHLKSLLPQLSRRGMDKKHKESVMSCLHQLEYNGGKESLTYIKARVPTYQSISA